MIRNRFLNILCTTAMLLILTALTLAQEISQQVGQPVDSINRDFHPEVGDLGSVPAQSKPQAHSATASTWGPTRTPLAYPQGSKGATDGQGDNSRISDRLRHKMQDQSGPDQSVSKDKLQPTLNPPPEKLATGAKKSNIETFQSKPEEPERGSPFENSLSFADKNGSVLERKTATSPFSAATPSRKKKRRTENAHLGLDAKKKPSALEQRTNGLQGKQDSGNDITKHSRSHSTSSRLGRKDFSKEYSD